MINCVQNLVYFPEHLATGLMRTENRCWFSLCAIWNRMRAQSLRDFLERDRAVYCFRAERGLHNTAGSWRVGSKPWHPFSIVMS